MDSDLRTPLDANVVNTSEAKTVIVTTEHADEVKLSALREKGVEFIFVPKTDKGLDLEAMLIELYKKGITDVLVEGGSEVNASFLRAGLIDKYLIYIAPKLLGGRNSLTPVTGSDVDHMDEALNVVFENIDKIGDDLCITAYPKQGEVK